MLKMFKYVNKPPPSHLSQCLWVLFDDQARAGLANPNCTPHTIVLEVLELVIESKHASVTVARSAAQALFAICHDPDTLAEVAKMAGKVVAVDVTAAGSVEWHEQDAAGEHSS